MLKGLIIEGVPWHLPPLQGSDAPTCTVNSRTVPLQSWWFFSCLERNSPPQSECTIWFYCQFVYWCRLHQLCMTVRGHSLKLSFPNIHTPSHTPSVTSSITPSNTPNSVSTLYIPLHHRQLHLCWMFVFPWHLCHSLSLSVTFHDKLRHRLRHVLYHSIVLPLSLFFYIYNLTLILAEVLSYSFRTSC